MKAALLGAIACVMIASPALAEGKQDFKLLNATGKPITAVYVSEASNPKWEEDVLGKDVLGDGESQDITFTGYGANVCKFDVKIQTDNKDEWIVENIDLCETNSVKFSMSGGKVQWEAN